MKKISGYIMLLSFFLAAMSCVDVESEVAFTTGKAAGAIVEVKEGKNHFNGNIKRFFRDNKEQNRP